MLWYLLASLNLTVTPSSDVAVNQTVTLLCELDPNPPQPIAVFFSLQSPIYTLCALEPNNGVCKNTTDSCRTIYNATCPSDTRYSLQMAVPQSWNNMAVLCQTLYEKSNNVIFSVKGIVLIKWSCSMKT